MAVTECNLHVGAPQSKHMHGMSKPQFYDFTRKLKENKLLLRDYAKNNQLASGHFISEDLLIRSNKEIQKNIMPFLKIIMSTATSNDPVFELTTYKRYPGGGYQSNFVAEDEAKDNFFREQQIEEEYKRFKPKSSAAKSTQMQFQVTSQYKKEDLTRKPINMDEINDSDLDMLLDDLKEVLDEEDISD